MPDKEIKIADETHVIPRKRGNGLVRREVWTDAGGSVTRYNLAYVNHRLTSVDNGRVFGYDNAHDGHHRHWYGTVEAIRFRGYEGVEEDFQKDLMQVLAEAKQ